MGYPVLTDMLNGAQLEVREIMSKSYEGPTGLHFRVSGPLAVIQLKSATLKYKILRDHPEFAHRPMQSLLEAVAKDPLYVVADKAHPDRRQHVAIHWLDFSDTYNHLVGPYGIILVTEELQKGIWDVVTAFLSRRLPRADTSTGGFIYARP